MSVEKNVSPTAVASGGGGQWSVVVVEKKRRKKEGERKKMTSTGMRKRKNQRETIENHALSVALCAFLPPIDGRTVIVTLSIFKDFPALFFRGSIRHWYVLIVTRAKFWRSFPSISFFFLLESA